MSNTIEISKTSKPKLMIKSNKSAKSIKSVESIKSVKSTKSMNYDKLISELNTSPIDFIINIDANKLIKLIKYTANAYYNGESLVSDEIYDFMLDTIKYSDPTNPILEQIGWKVNSKNVVKLCYWMGSMNKLTPIDDILIEKWLEKNLEPYVYSIKLDGVSGLLIYDLSNNKLNLYTRGDGTNGTDITHLIQYIKSIPTMKEFIKSVQTTDFIQTKYAIRGELLISKDKFKKYSNIMANTRNMVSGLINSKNIDINRTTDIDFVAYEIIDPWYSNQIQQWETLGNLGFKVVLHEELQTTNISEWSEILSKLKKTAEYDIDGLIIQSNIILLNRNTSGNPSYAFAFKDMSLLETAKVEVLNVEWSISKDSYIIPTLNLVPTHLSGVTISSVTANNAKYVLDNKLGPGSIIELIRSGEVIPKIKRIIKSSEEAQLPTISYKWTKTNIHIIAIEKTNDQLIKELTFFFKKLDIKNIDESTVKKLIDANINTISQIMNIDQYDLTGIEGFGTKLINKIKSHINQRMQTLNMLDIMTASNAFGHNMGMRRLKKIMEFYPDIIKLYTDNENHEIIEKIKKLDGFDIITAEQFTLGLHNFIKLFNTFEPKMRKQLRLSIINFMEEQEQIQEQIQEQKEQTQEQNQINQNSKKSIFGLNIVFSGIRYKELEKIIESKGGKIGSSISSKTNILITIKKELEAGTNSKIIKAKQLNIPIYTKEEFETLYMCD